MSCQVSDLVHDLREEAAIRLDQVEESLNRMSEMNFARSEYFGREDLLKERLQLKLLLGELQERRPLGNPVEPHDHSHLTLTGVVKIEFETEEDDLIFKMVRKGQMFIDNAGNLLQRSFDDSNDSWKICNSAGEARGELYHFDDNDRIKKILPSIRRIAF